MNESLYRQGPEAFLFERTMEKLHHNAIAAYTFEKKFWDEEHTEQELRDYISKEMPIGMQDTLNKAIREYFYRTNSKEAFQKEVETYIGGSLDDETYALQAGTKIFQNLTGGMLPHNDVYLRQQKGFFVLEFTDETDFVSILDERHLEIVDGKKKSKVSGLFNASEFLIIQKNNTFGIKNGDTIPEDALYGRVPVIYVDKSQGSDEFFRQLVAHEKQHFINKFFIDNEDPFSSLKDEFIASFRSHFEGMDFYKKDVYDHVSENLNPEQHAQLVEKANEVNQILSEFENFFINKRPTLEQSALITYHILDVPFENIPTRLNAVLKYYREKITSHHLDTCYPPSDYDDEYVSAMNDIQYGLVKHEDTIQKDADSALTAYKIWLHAYEEALNSLFLTDKQEEFALKCQNAIQAKSNALLLYSDYKNAIQ